MIAAKYRLFTAEPKASKFPRYAHAEEVAVRHFDLGRHAISPGWSATESYPASTAGLVLRSRLVERDWAIGDVYLQRFAVTALPRQ